MMANANLQAQFRKLCRLDRTGSFSTKRTYRQAMGQFLDYCSDNFHAMNINRLGDKHIRAFVQIQLDRGVGQRTLQKQVAAIKHFLLIAGVRITVSNRQLGMAGRSHQVLQGATDSEYQQIQKIAHNMEKRLMDWRRKPYTFWAFALIKPSISVMEPCAMRFGLGSF